MLMELLEEHHDALPMTLEYRTFAVFRQDQNRLRKLRAASGHRDAEVVIGTSIVRG
jgi:hypothetical protein